MSTQRFAMRTIVLLAAFQLAGCTKDPPDAVQQAAGAATAEDSTIGGGVPTMESPASGALPRQENAAQFVSRVFTQHGAASPQAALAYGVASATCAPGAFPVTDAGSAAHRDAVARIKSACLGFDQSSLPKPSYTLNLYVAAGKNETEIAAMREDALSTLRASSSIQPEAVSAAWFLIEQGAFPEQDSYGVSDEKLAEAFGVAQSLKSCQVTGCGPNDLVTLSLCARATCPPNASYETAVSQAYSPSQFKLIQELRNKRV